MFELSKSILESIKESLVSSWQPVVAGAQINYVSSCAGCTGTCKNSCSGGCKNSCRGDCKGSCSGGCTRSCKGHSR